MGQALAVQGCLACEAPQRTETETVAVAGEVVSFDAEVVIERRTQEEAEHGHVPDLRCAQEEEAEAQAAESHGHTPPGEAQQRGREDTGDSAEQPEGELIDPWAIPVGEVKMGSVLRRTLKSTICSARWRGTRVVAKFASPLADALGAPAAKGGASESLGGTGSTMEDTAARDAAKEMLQEIRLLSMMRHPNLVMFLGACLEPSMPFFIVQYMEGGDLEDYYRNHSTAYSVYRPGWTKFKGWATAVAQALCYLHSLPVIHRDLKPMNLLLDGAEELKVADFGISKLMSPTGQGTGLDGEIGPCMSGGVGTWRYMAPEVARYERYTDRADIYSFSLVMWFMYTGRHPFKEQFGQDALPVLKEYSKGNEPRPDVLASGGRCGPPLPEDLHQLLRECWHESPGQRPAAEACVDRLEALRAPRRTISWRPGA